MNHVLLDDHVIEVGERVVPAVEARDADMIHTLGPAALLANHVLLNDRLTEVGERVAPAVEARDADTIHALLVDRVTEVGKRVGPEVRVEGRIQKGIQAGGDTSNHTTRDNTVERALITKEEATEEFLSNRTAMGSTR